MRVNIKFIQRGTTVNVQANEGETILDIVRRNGKPDGFHLECACEGSLACSTCHVVVDPAFYDKTIADVPISDDENDMLDLAFGLSKTSRLGCQIRINSSMEGMTLIIPTEQRR